MNQPSVSPGHMFNSGARTLSHDEMGKASPVLAAHTNVNFNLMSSVAVQ